MKFTTPIAMIDPSFYLPVAQAAEEHGFDSIAVPDSIAYPRESSSKYPYNPDGTREFLGLQLADENGQPLARVQPVRASGEFRLEDLACGRYRLRCGGLDELEAGRFRHELALEVLPGENPPLEIEL